VIEERRSDPLLRAVSGEGEKKSDWIGVQVVSTLVELGSTPSFTSCDELEHGESPCAGVVNRLAQNLDVVTPLLSSRWAADRPHATLRSDRGPLKPNQERRAGPDRDCGLQPGNWHIRIGIGACLPPNVIR